MSATLPARPELAVRKSSYAADFDEAERALPGIGQSKDEVTSRTSKSSTIYERLSRTSTAGQPLSRKVSFQTNSLMVKCHRGRYFLS